MAYQSKLSAAAAAAVLSMAAFALPAKALTYNPASSGLPGVTVTSGFVNSWYVPAKMPNPNGGNPAQVNNTDFPDNQDPSTIETWLEGALFLNQPLTAVGNGNCNTANFTCTTEKIGSTSLAAQIFAIHFGAGELVYQYASIISNFAITLPAGQGLGLSNIRAFNGRPNTNPVPVPAALPLLASGLAALGYVGWRRKRKSVA